ncbi:anti-sigma factor ChrR (cupin superfamily) [Vibrio sp. ES.051]|uniref:cupin domain-containing protein n=1 Tax=Vibrio sp. ES.051 TaxID=1761909 RepID=UPI000BF65EF0|nr:cupin domain-containing protein [Vibrio sp. ES.051]PFG57835.1 anti-sigma factor ChrR (cupin superfamily) [Vibrio sp. ES.051]
MLNMDFSQRIVVDTDKQDWVSSPATGVWRKPLEREAKESGYTTSVVKYEPHSQFTTHSHPFGEEILVLEGVFSDENGDYPAGTYLRNPPGSQHAPFSREGCVILVKLNQFAPHDLETVCIKTNKAQWLPGIGGLQVMPLHNFEHEHVALVKWPKGEKFQPHRHFGGEEIFVLLGEFKDENGSYSKHTWVRNPHQSEHFPYVEEETVIWVKTGHLPID